MNFPQNKFKVLFREKEVKIREGTEGEGMAEEIKGEVGMNKRESLFFH